MSFHMRFLKYVLLMLHVVDLRKIITNLPDNIVCITYNQDMQMAFFITFTVILYLLYLYNSLKNTTTISLKVFSAIV